MQSGLISKLRVLIQHAAMLVVFCIVSIGAAQAEWEEPEDRPIYINQIEKYGFVFVRKQTAAAGSLYVLNREDLSGRQNVQIAFDKDGIPQIFRFIQVLGDNEVVNAVGLTQSVIELAQEIRFGWKGFEDPIRKNVNATMAEYNKQPRNLVHKFKITEGVEGTIRTDLGTGVAAMDLPIRYPETILHKPDELRKILSDLSFLLIDQTGKRTESYHAPNGRYVANKEIEVLKEDQELEVDGVPVPDEELEYEIIQVMVTGSWRISDESEYCIQEAPSPLWTCSNLYQRDNTWMILEKNEGQVNTTALSYIIEGHGNLRNLPVLRVPDTLDADEVRKFVTRRSEYYRQSTEDQPTKAFFAGNGNYAGRLADDETVIGRWSVLHDGRRCLQQVFPEELDWQCHFLRETDGGTFALIDEDGNVIREAVMKLGNPENL